jgi:hypothetical protein
MEIIAVSMTFKHVTSPTQATTYVPKKKKFLEEIC